MNVQNQAGVHTRKGMAPRFQQGAVMSKDIRFKEAYSYQEKAKSSPLIQAWLARVDAAVTAMRGVDVRFVTFLMDPSKENQVYHDHENQTVSEFLSPVLSSNEGDELFDEETLPYYRVRFSDGVELIADDLELFSWDPRFANLISAVSGAFSVARDMGFVGPWDLVAHGSEEEKAVFLATFSVLKFDLPFKHWSMHSNTPQAFRDVA